MNVYLVMSKYKTGLAAAKALFLFALCPGAGLLLSALGAYGQDSAIIANPVLPGVKDAGVLHYNGEYYIGGVSTNGSFYVSSDLVSWEGPYHVFSMDNDWTDGPSAYDSQIHASDIHYLNGIFHHYWSVNYWGKDQHVVHIGHATSPNALGPYREPVKDTWLTNRIDPHLFRDKDGQLYLYMVKFTDGNTIWGRPMKDPASFSGAPRYLFASLPGTWETLDNRVAEGPWVIRYRDQYYLMYNANHTSPNWGNYTLGVAQADGPLEFNHGNKYPHPVVQSNQEGLEDIYPDILRWGLETEGSSSGISRISGDPFLYTVDPPEENWNQRGFDYVAWKKGAPGFGSAVIENSTTRQVKTSWKTDRIWVRKTFSISKEAMGNLSLRMHHDGETRVFLNGTLIYSSNDRAYRHWNFDRKARALLKEGENLLAVESRAGRRSGFLDVSLFDMKDQVADDILFSPGQPNILRGPNGFEWWLIYMANKNAESRGQYINRVHFFNKKLVVDGITAWHTPGHHPVPAAPTFSDLFNESGSDTSTGSSLKNKWKILSGTWKQENKELIQLSSVPASALPRSQPARYYLFEAGVKMIAPDAVPGRPDSASIVENTASKRAGIYAWWKDEDNWIKVVLDRESGKWTWEFRREGKLQTASYALPEDFNYEVYHKLTVYKNGEEFRVHIDGLPAPGQELIKTTGRLGAGLPGLYAGSGASFDGVLYTIGWDEFDQRITGWTAGGLETSAALSSPSAAHPRPQAALQSPKNTSSDPNAEWISSAEGIGPDRKAGEHSVFKGDLLDQYEFSLQVTFSQTDSADTNAGRAAARDAGAGAGAAGNATPETNEHAGIYAVYTDEDNYLKAVLDYQERQLLISGKRKGKPLKTHRLSLETSHPLYANMSYSDFIEKHFTFDTPTWINSLRLSKTPHEQPDTLIEDIYRKMDIFYQLHGRWHLLEDYREKASPHPGFEEIGFAPIKASALKLVNKAATDHQFYTYKLWTGELFRESYHLRVAKLRGNIIFWVNGKEMLRIRNDFSASRVGLTTVNSAARFNGITFFNLAPGKQD